MTINPFDLIVGRFPSLLTDPFSSEQLWNALSLLMGANAPSGGAFLPGGIADEIGAIAREWGLERHFIRRIGSTGNAGMWIGADKAQPDVILFAHMDRPTFGLKSVDTGEVYPMCAIRLPAEGYFCAAKSVRFQSGRLMTASLGEFSAEKGTMIYKAHAGDLRWYDHVMFDSDPRLRDGVVTGTGLDNALGVVTGLAAAAALLPLQDALVSADRRVLIVFTDGEEGIPDAFFGHGASMFTHAVPQPVIGCIIADAQTAGAGVPPQLGLGASHGVVSGWSKGSVAIPNAVALAADLAAAANAHRRFTVQMNKSYLSRSDDMVLGRWAHILGMIGVPMLHPHTVNETARLEDLARTCQWLAIFTAASCGVMPEINSAYALI